MTRKGFAKLEENRRFELLENRDVRVLFGKHQGLTFKNLSVAYPHYLEYLLEDWQRAMTAEVQRRCRHWIEQSGAFFI